MNNSKNKRTMTNHKKQLMSLRVPANSFKTAAPTINAREAAPARPVFNLRSFLSAGFKWPRNKQKSEPGAPTEDHDHRHKGSYFCKRIYKQMDVSIEKTDPLTKTAFLMPSSNFYKFWRGLKERFFRFMEILVFLDSPRELAFVLETFDSKPVVSPQQIGLSVTNVFTYRKMKEERSRREASGIRITEKITSIAARYRNFQNQPIPVVFKQPSLRPANYGLRIANAGFSPGYS
jgi:hypothetical protein